LGDATREAFVWLYDTWDVVGELAKEFEEQYKGKDPLPDPPPLGKFDISMVRYAEICAVFLQLSNIAT
jgi:hypothetical protein